MSRYTGPRLRVMRALGVALPGLSSKMPERRPYPPGQHGPGRPKKPSDYRRQLQEKQKLRFNYGVGEKQFRNYMAKAKASKMAAGQKLLELLERRLDNAVFRAGWAATIPAARQMVNHGHILVNGKRVTIPSYSVKAGEVLEIREKSRKLKMVEEALVDGNNASRVPGWLSVSGPKATVDALPDRESVMFDIDVQLVVEYYAKRM